MKKLFLTLWLLAAALSATATVTNFERNADSKACRHWVDSVMSTLSLRQRVAQLVFPNIEVNGGEATRASIRRLIQKEGCGGLLFGKGSLENYVTMTNYAREVSRVPVMMTLDGEWGAAMRVPEAPRFPHNMGLGAIRNSRLLYDYGREMARQCRAMGIDVNFAPVADVNTNPANPVIGYRSFGQYPERVAEMVTQYSRGLEDGGVQAVAKHFPGHGDTSTDSHKTVTTVNHTDAQLQEVDLVPFRSFIKGGMSGVMVGHIVTPAWDDTGRPASLSHAVTTGKLRDEMGFTGLIYTDALAMKGAVAPGKNSAVEALRAGADVLLGATSPVSDIDAIVKAVSSGSLSESIIDEHCRRVLTYKYLLGLPDRKPVTLHGLEKELNSPEADRVIRELAAASATILRNSNATLPLKTSDASRLAITAIGSSENKGLWREDISRYTAAPYYSSASAVPAKDGQTVIAGIFGDTQADRAAFRELCARHHCVVAVFFINPYKTNKFAPLPQNVTAAVLMYDDIAQTVDYGAQAVFGGIEVSGRLPVSLPKLMPDGTYISTPRTRLGFTSPAGAGLKASLSDSIDALINRGLHTGAFPGAQILVAKDGKVVIDRCYGVTTPGGPAVTPRTIYDLASVSKALGTLPGLMKAYDNGLYSLDAPVSRYLPPLRRRADKADITVRSMLYHESGMPPSLNMYDIMLDTASYSGRLFSARKDRTHDLRIGPKAYVSSRARLRHDITSSHADSRHPLAIGSSVWVGADTRDSLMQRIYTIPLRKNRRYTYSCLNFCTLMAMEEALTDQPHDSWVTEHIYHPVGAYSTMYRPAGAYPADMIAPTEKDPLLRREHIHGHVHDELAAFSGGVQGNAGLFSNARDLAAVCQMFLNGGTYAGNTVLSPATVKLFTTDHSANSRRGLGFDKPDTKNPDNSPTTSLAPAEVYGHLGFTGTVFWVDPVNNIIFIFLTNRVNPTRENSAFNRLNIRPALFEQVYRALPDK